MKTQWFMLWFILLGLPFTAKSQSDLLFNNQQINSIARNPAAIDQNGLINAYLGAHQQWIGFEDAPNMQWASVSTYFDRYNMGVSLNVFNQSEGVALTQNIKLGYAYNVRINTQNNLSLGIGAGVYFRRLDYSKLHFAEEETDIPLYDQNVIRPDFDFGLEYNYKNLKLGLAANHITVFNSSATLQKIPIQTQAYINYQLRVGENMLLVPEVNYFMSSRISTVGFSMDFQYRSIFSAGMEYRTGQSFILRAGLHLSDKIELRYAYDMGSGSFATYHSGIHEVVIIGRFSKRSSGLNSPRFLDN